MGERDERGGGEGGEGGEGGGRSDGVKEEVARRNMVWKRRRKDMEMVRRRRMNRKIRWRTRGVGYCGS